MVWVFSSFSKYQAPAQSKGKPPPVLQTPKPPKPLLQQPSSLPASSRGRLGSRAITPQGPTRPVLPGEPALLPPLQRPPGSCGGTERNTGGPREPTAPAASGGRGCVWVGVSAPPHAGTERGGQPSRSGPTRPRRPPPSLSQRGSRGGRRYLWPGSRRSTCSPPPPAGWPAPPGTGPRREPTCPSWRGRRCPPAGHGAAAASGTTTLPASGRRLGGRSNEGGEEPIGRSARALTPSRPSLPPLPTPPQAPPPRR